MSQPRAVSPACGRTFMTVKVVRRMAPHSLHFRPAGISALPACSLSPDWSLSARIPRISNSETCLMATTRRILIVDDDVDMREALVEQLALHDEFEAVAAENATKSLWRGCPRGIAADFNSAAPMKLAFVILVCCCMSQSS